MNSVETWSKVMLLFIMLHLTATSGTSAPPLPPTTELGKPTKSDLTGSISSIAALPTYFSTLGIRISEDRVSIQLEIFLSSDSRAKMQGVHVREVPAMITWDDSLIRQNAFRHMAGPPQKLRFEFEKELQEMKVGRHQLVISGLVCSPSKALDATILTTEGTVLAGVSPGAPAIQTSRLYGGWGERMLLRYQACPAALVVNLEHREVPASAQIFARVIQYGVPIITALVILLLSTLIQRWLLLRGTQQGVRQALEIRVQRIEEESRKAELREELLSYVRQLREKPEYGGFSPKFTGPLDALLKTGNIDDIESYRKKLQTMKMGVKFSWIFFARGGA